MPLLSRGRVQRTEQLLRPGATLQERRRPRLGLVLHSGAVSFLETGLAADAVVFWKELWSDAWLLSHRVLSSRIPPCGRQERALPWPGLGSWECLAGGELVPRGRAGAVRTGSRRICLGTGDGRCRAETGAPSPPDCPLCSLQTTLYSTLLLLLLLLLWNSILYTSLAVVSRHPDHTRWPRAAGEGCVSCAGGSPPGWPHRL